MKLTRTQGRALQVSADRQRDPFECVCIAFVKSVAERVAENRDRNRGPSTKLICIISALPPR